MNTKISINDFIDAAYIKEKAEGALLINPLHITDATAPLSRGEIHDFYSNGDYWWPNPDTADGLPYVRRDGMSNPENFNAHRQLLRGMRTSVASLAAGYKITGDERYAAHATRMLYEFFIDKDTYMAPHLEYAQAIPGVCDGRSIGIIDTLHLTEVPFAIKALKNSPSMTDGIYNGLKEWFSKYLAWMNTSQNGIEERDCTNNHAICWHVQALSFAGFVGNEAIIRECIERYKKILLPNQMRCDGGFTDELGRTKPYAYSIFVLDNAVSLVYLATLYGGEDLWSYETADGRGIKLGLDFLLPYLTDKSSWFLPPDVEHFEGWPAREAFMVLSGIKYNDKRYLELYSSLPPESDDDEVRRSTAIRQPILLI